MTEHESATADKGSAHANDNSLPSPQNKIGQENSNDINDQNEHQSKSNSVADNKGNDEENEDSSRKSSNEYNSNNSTQNKNSVPVPNDVPDENKNCKGIKDQHKSETAQIFKPVINQPPISIYSLSHPANNNENGQSHSILRSFSTNIISPESSSSNVNKSAPQSFHRQISITNNNNSPISPIKQILSVPIIPMHNNNDMLSFQQSNDISSVTLNFNQSPSTIPEPQQQQPEKKHRHHHRRHRKHQEQQDAQEEENQENQDLYPTILKSPICISPSALQDILSKEDDEPELDLTPETSAVLETIKKTGKLSYNSITTTNKNSKKSNSISARTAAVAPTSQDGLSARPNIIRKLQRDKVNAIIKGKYDEAKEADTLTRRVTDAVLESVEEDRRYELIRQAEEKLEYEKQTFSEFHKGWIEKVKEEEEALQSRMNSLEEIHVAEQRDFENKWNSEDFLRRFSKPSASLLQLKAIERSMVIAKMFDDAKIVKSRAEQLERLETREQQNRAESEMKVERKRLLDRQKREMASLKEKCDNLLSIVKRNMEKEEAPYKARIIKLEQDLKSGNENKGKIVPPVITPRGANTELLTAKTAFKFSAYKVTSKSLKLKIKPLGCVTLNEKAKTKGSKVKK